MNTDYRTMVNGKDAPWTPAIYAEFEARVGPLMEDGERMLNANYYTPRPYVDQYNRGSDRYGFTYTLNGHRVCQISWQQVSA